MKKFILIFAIVFTLSGCEPANTDEEITCELPEELLNGVCQIPELECTLPEEVIDGECKVPLPTCEANETIVDGACQIVDPECIDPEVLREHECIIIPDPVIILTGESEITVEAGSVFDKSDVTAVYDGQEITVVITGIPNMRELGTYTITYNASTDDKSADELTRTLHIVDTTAPLLTFSEFDDFTQELGVSYNHTDIIVNDNSDEYLDIELIVTGEIDVNALGDYELSYHAVDSSGNTSESITKTVSVIEPVELDFTNRFMKDNTAFYDPNPFMNSYVFENVEWIHRGLVFENGEYKTVFYFFLHNLHEEDRVLKKIEFICPEGDNYVYEITDDQIDYALYMPLDCVKDNKIGIITYLHDENQPGKVWNVPMNIGAASRKASKILQLDLLKGNLN
ncbi:DUF5011 domain-containing protein [Candidatus Izimaplasma bacterium]|nr:DUF5011 domain-containing protein [Candidatus Izimaplasma bacterium]